MLLYGCLCLAEDKFHTNLRISGGGEANEVEEWALEGRFCQSLRMDVSHGGFLSGARGKIALCRLSRQVLAGWCISAADGVVPWAHDE